VVAKTDVKDASSGVLKDLKRFQGEKEDDLKRYMVRKFPFSVTRVLTTEACFRQMPPRMGQEKHGHLGRSKARS